MGGIERSEMNLVVYSCRKVSSSPSVSSSTELILTGHHRSDLLIAQIFPGSTLQLDRFSQWHNTLALWNRMISIFQTTILTYLLLNLHCFQRILILSGLTIVLVLKLDPVDILSFPQINFER